MKIAIDARPAENEGYGIATYTYNLIENLLKIDRVNQYFLLVNSNILQQRLPKKKNITFRKIKSGWMSLFEQIELPLVLQQIKPDVFHSPSFVVPCLYFGKTMVTIHDIIHLLFASDYGLKQALYYQFIALPVIKRAKKIVAVSNSTKDDIISKLGVEKAKIAVIYNGVSEPLFMLLNGEEIFTNKNRLNLPEKYLLYLGGRKKHKNIDGLFRAFAKFKETDTEKYYLVISGVKEASITALSDKYQINSWLRYAGVVKDEDLIYLYKGASLFLFLSLYEGFGLPPLEAMACGVPVIVSNRASLPEVVGNVGVCVDPNNTSEIAANMATILNDKTRRERMSKEGIKRAEGFTWEKCATATLQLYEDIYMSNRKKL